MTTFVKPRQFSALGLRSNWPNGNWALSHAHAASLDIGLNDFIVIADVMRERMAAVFASIFIQKWGGAPLRGYRVQFDNTSIVVGLSDNVGGVVWQSSNPDVIEQGRNILVVFVDRDGSIHFFVNGANAGTVVTDPTTYIDENNAALFYSSLNSPTAVSDGVSNLQLYIIDPVNFPDAVDRAKIVAEMQSDPYVVPCALSSRAAYAAEQRIALDFSDLDPEATSITDNSAYGNHMTLVGGATVADCVREYGSV